MTVNNAKEMLCPYTHTECKVDKCMSWIMYETYPIEAGRERRRLKAEGYEEIGKDIYAKLVDFTKE